MTNIKKGLISLVAIATLSLIGCGSSSNKNNEIVEDKSFNSTEFLQDVKGVLSTQNTTQAKLNTFIKTFSIIPKAYAGDIELSSFKEFWNDTISTTDNSDSLMGFIDKNIFPVLTGLENAQWDFSDENNGAGKLTIETDNGSHEFDFYSELINVENGRGAKIYFNTKTKNNYSSKNYKSSSTTLNSDDETILTIKETDNLITFYWVSMSKYADRDDNVWNIEEFNGKEFIKYKRESDDNEYKIYPNVNRNKDGASGGRTVLYIVDKNKQEIYFEHFTSTETHNRQEHYAVKLKSLDRSSGKLRVGSDTKINLTRVTRQYFDTTINNTNVSLVNDSNNSKVTWDILQGSLIDGVKYAHSEGGVLSKGCIVFTDDLDYNNISTSDTSCSVTISSLPTLTNDFNKYTNDPINYAYLPATGNTYDTIDLRVNMHSIYDEDYDGSWMSKLNVD